METYNKNELELHWRELSEKIKEGAVFIYPTDTIYGIGCNALDEKAVKKIREIKERNQNPFSVWAPSKKWIDQNCKLSEEAKKWVGELPGPYTLILPLKDKDVIAKSVSMSDSLGVRIPNHWLHDLIFSLKLPIVTTSANKIGESPMTSLEDLDQEVKRQVDFIIYEGEKKGRPSKLIHLTEAEKIVER